MMRMTVKLVVENGGKLLKDKYVVEGKWEEGGVGEGGEGEG